MGPVYSSDTEENVYTADFTSFTETGTYYLDVHDVGYSAQFSIKTDVYNEVFKTLMLGMYLWRSGIEISAAYKGDIFAHKASHLESPKNIKL